jgi:Flp pilus assembly protein TadB
MTASAIKPERKWLYWSVQAGVHKIKTRINLAAEIRNRAQAARQITEHWQSVLKRLDRGTKLPQLSGDGILLGECRFNLDRTAISEAIEKRDA